MKRLSLQFALLAVFTLVALVAVSPAVATESPSEPVPIVRQWQPRPAEAGGAPGQRVEPVILWTITGVGVGVVVFGTLYLFKRRVGGFPEHPSWVAPITIMPSRESPDERTYGEVPPQGHGPQH
jgi:hypothetical protein